LYQSINLSEDLYYQDSIPKDAVFLHHTSGYFRPDWVVNTWNKKKSTNKIRAAASFVIGGLDPLGEKNQKWDGVVIESFDPSNWAHHLFLKTRNNTFLNQKSIAIELCNYGGLVLSEEDKFYTYTHLEIPNNQVISVENPYRGFYHFHAYTEKQIESLRKLLIYLEDRFDLDFSRGLKDLINKQEIKIPENLSIVQLQNWLNKNGFTDNTGKRLKESGEINEKTSQALLKVGKSAFELDLDAGKGSPGLWSHSNVRKDKLDIFPQKEIIQMIISL
jgi:hypothetical protein